MYHFWKVIIEPTLELIKPKNIVEVGSDYGFNTEKLAFFCQKHGSTLHVIDPLPKYDIDEWKKKYGEYFVFHKNLSLNVLWKIEDIDTVLIDGDHNWYTVFNELKLIEKCAVEKNKNFPLVMLHDIGWPYGRRDLYYDPETIPIGYRKPYKKLGMSLEHSTLLEQGGLNSHLYNAIYENNYQNGVLTAVEDFLKETQQPIQFIKITGLYGLGMIFSKELQQLNPEFAAWVQELSGSSAIWAVNEEVEKARLETEIMRQEKSQEVSELQRQDTALRKELGGLKRDLLFKESIVAAAHEEREKLQAEIESQSNILQENSRTITELNERLAAKESAVFTAYEEREKLQAEIESQRKTLQENSRTIVKIGEHLTAKESELKLQRSTLQENRKTVAELNARIKAKERADARVSDEITRSRVNEEQLSQWLRKIKSDTDAILSSWRWRIGNKMVRLVELAMFRPRVPTAIDHIRSILNEYDDWVKNGLPWETKESVSLLTNGTLQSTQLPANKGSREHNEKKN